MQTGIRYRAYPSVEQAESLSQWIGCARVIWNAKCDEDQYLRSFASKYLPIKTYAQPDKSYGQYKTELTPWLKDCPSQILRNSATIWANTYQNFFKKRCGRPVRKNRQKGNYIWLTRELFDLKKVNGKWILNIGTKTKNLGTLNLKWHRKPRVDQLPKSLWIRVVNGHWTVSFSYDDGRLEDNLFSNEEHLKWLSECSEEKLELLITPIDRGVAIPFQTHNKSYKPGNKTLKKQKGREKYMKRCQRKLSRQKKGSNRRNKTKHKIANIHTKTANVRKDFLHKTSTDIVKNTSVIVMEDLNLKNMSKRANKKLCEKTGRYLKNGARAKSGLNKSLLGVGMGLFETYVNYKAYRQNKPVFKINPINTSRECSSCGYIHPDNRSSQAMFQCKKCGHTDNADRNAAWVIRKRAVQYIKNSGTELVGANKSVLRSGTGANLCKTFEAQASNAVGCLSKKTLA